MPYAVIENFARGLDTRKTLLTTENGALLTCKNAHITRGGEIEKAKAFVQFAQLPLGTFGLHSASGSLYTFGSSAAPTMPASVTYQCLQHPNGANMTGIRSVENYNGRIYAIATFDDGSTHHYYDGSRVAAWDGIVATVGDNAGVAAALAALINATAEFSATSSGSVVTITSATNNQAFTLTPSTVNGGSNPNQTLVAATTQAAGVSQPQISTLTVGGTFEALDRFTARIVISGAFDSTFTVSGSAGGTGVVVRSYGSKMYSTTRSLLYFSEINDPTKWGGSTNGAGFINIQNQDSGSEELSALGVYQGKLAVFSRRSVQIWNMDADPAKNILQQTLNNVGTFAPRSVVNFGDLDVFFLSDSGVRSIRARDASNAATVSDIGTNIDTLIAADMQTIAESVRNAAVAIIEPNDGRYWLAMGGKIYVYSYFPSASISAWSTYEPGFAVSDLTYASGRIYARSGDMVYLYGGQSGNEYDSTEVEVVLPFFDAKKPATRKTLSAIDATCEGAWRVYVGMDFSAPTARDLVGDIKNSTFMLSSIQTTGIGTHIGFRLVTTGSGYARLGNIVAHYQMNESD